MFLDASAIVALLLRELGYEDLEAKLEAHAGSFYSSQIARYEAVAAIARAKTQPSTKRPALSREKIDEATVAVDDFLGGLSTVEIVVEGEIGTRAIEAMKLYGKNTGHPAALNMGDCFALACAKAHSLQLLYKGNDFPQTEVG